MTFAVLGTIGTAIGTGLGAVSGGIAAGASALGASAGLASAIGTIGTGALVGSGLGAAGSAITGGDPGKGAMFGALGGGITGGLGSLAGSGTGAAATSATSNIANAATPSVSGMFPAGATSMGSMVSEAGLGAAPSASVASMFPAAAPTLSSIAGSGIGSTLGSVGTEVAKAALPTAIQGVGDMMGPSYSGPSSAELIAKDQQEAKKAKELGAQTWGLAAGGSVDLHDGDFIFPADIVSALGNGSTKAGAQFLDEFFGTA